MLCHLHQELTRSFTLFSLLQVNCGTLYLNLYFYLPTTWTHLREEYQDTHNPNLASIFRSLFFLENQQFKWAFFSCFIALDQFSNSMKEKSYIYTYIPIPFNYSSKEWTSSSFFTIIYLLLFKLLKTNHLRCVSRCVGVLANTCFMVFIFLYFICICLLMVLCIFYEIWFIIFLLYVNFSNI